MSFVQALVRVKPASQGDPGPIESWTVQKMWIRPSSNHPGYYRLYWNSTDEESINLIPVSHIVSIIAPKKEVSVGKEGAT